MTDKNNDLNNSRFQELLKLFLTFKEFGYEFCPLTQLDSYISKNEYPIFIRHDIHDLNLNALLNFAEKEVELNIYGSYFFMPPEHPRTKSAYGFNEQVEAMTAIQEMGHEIGIHVDPYFLIHQKQQSLSLIIETLLSTFAKHGIDVKVGTMHGNSRFKHLDKNGFGTSFDLFEELSRQPDYPRLTALEEDSREIIINHRVSLNKMKFSHWGDQPMWSARNNAVATNYLSDNRLGKQGTFEILIRPETLRNYYLSKQAVPGQTNLPQEGVTSTEDIVDFSLHENIPIDSELLTQLAKDNKLGPLLLLLHPEFYCSC